MSDVFISYSHVDRPLAESLAKDLQARGYRVWWDSQQLLGSDDYTDMIMAAVKKAKAAIVIWTNNSAKSVYVRDEARSALHNKKLVAVRDPSFDPMNIPFGFGGQHTDDIRNREHIFRAIHKLGARPVDGGRSQGASKEASEWDRLKSSSSIEDIVAFIGSNPPPPYRQAAVARLKSLASDRSTQIRLGNAPSNPLTMSTWQAFLSGLKFQAPKFQLSAQVMPIAWAYVAILFAFAIALLALVQSQYKPYVLLLPFSALVLLAWNRFCSIVKQRNLAASLMLALSFAVLGSFYFSFLGDMLMDKIDHNYWTDGDKSYLSHTMTIIGLLTCVALAGWKIRSVR